MDNFIVSARKYRPATFDTVVGQESITSTLKNAIINKQLAQAFLFCGPRGVGKTTCARILAKTINCLNPVNQVEACDKCESCLSFNRSASFNIHELDAASNNSVDDIRNLVDQVRVPPQLGKYKVYIIDEVHMLSASAFNAFLKTLEEPPAYAKFILATTEKHKIIPTILSRCQIFDFKRISVKDIADYISFVARSEGVEIEDEAAHAIAQKADGAMRDALSFFDHLNILDNTYYFRILDQVLAQDSAGLLLTINEIIERGFDGQHFLIGLGEHLRNLLVCKDAATISLLDVSPNLQKKYLEQARQSSSGFLLKSLEIHNQFDQSYKVSNNKRLQLELALLQICTAKAFEAGGTPEKKKSLIPPEGLKENPVQEERPPVAQPAEQKPISVKPPRQDKPVVSTGSIRSISIRPENHFAKNGQDKAVENIAGSMERQDFDQEKLEKVWNYYTESIAGQYPNLYSILSSRKPVLGPEYVIEIQLENRAQEITFKERKTDLIDFLRDELRNYGLQLNTILVEGVSQTKPYMADDKYRAMLEKNSDLKTLRETLDLELEL
jgi:DNA polymerase-3 subunit gamma/tau